MSIVYFNFFHSKQYAKSEVLSEPMTRARYFQMCFPGFLIQGHKVISWDDVENASLRCEVALLSNNDCEHPCNNLHGKLNSSHGRVLV